MLTLHWTWLCWQRYLLHLPLTPTYVSVCLQLMEQQVPGSKAIAAQVSRKTAEQQLR
jgi:hypothetical protein